MLDLKIENARFFDGDRFREEQQIGIKDGVVVTIGWDSLPAAQSVDGRDKIIAPAFVDTHSHADFQVRQLDNDGGSALSQGVGTAIVGNCGMSATPLAPLSPLLMCGADDRSRDRLDHLHKMSSDLSMNVGELLGHGTLRLAILGEPRAASSSEIASMCALLAEYLESGWAGMSVGLNYGEATGYSEEELAKLSAVLARFGKPLTCHIRDQGNGILSAMDEVIGVTRTSGSAVLISHLRPLSGRLDHLVPDIERRIESTDHAHFDLYPYVAGCTTLEFLFLKWFHALPTRYTKFSIADVDTAVASICINSYDDIHVMEHTNPMCIGKTIADIARQIGISPGDAAQEIYFEDPKSICIYDNTSTTYSVDRLIQHERCLLGSDSWIYPGGFAGICHPRNFGAFTRFLSRYVRDGNIDLVSGLRRITSRAADYFGLNAGRIAVGSRADLVLFGLEELQDNADVQNPSRQSSGVDRVWIAGQQVFGAGLGNRNPRSGMRLAACHNGGLHSEGWE